MSSKRAARRRRPLWLGLASARLSGALSAVITGLHAGLLAMLVWLGATPQWVFPIMLESSIGHLLTRAIDIASAARRAPPSQPLLPAAKPPACASDMVLIDGDFCPWQPYLCAAYSDKAEYRCARYVRGQRCRRPLERRRYCIDRYEWPNRVGAQPRVMVDWNEAKAACAGVGKRLCRRSEWVLACEGPKRLPYPWGYRRRPSPCNIDRPAIPFDVHALFDKATREEELARLWQADPSGSHPDCVSGFGVFDMAGNVDEWTDNQLDDPSTRRPSTLNGGYWGPVRDTCRLTTKKHTPRFRFYQVGFRCCADARTGPTYPAKIWYQRGDRDARNDDEGAGKAKAGGAAEGGGRTTGGAPSAVAQEALRQ